MALNENLIGYVVVGALVLAYFTKPDQAAHESKVSEVMQTLQTQQADSGSWLKWLGLKGADLVRTGRFQEGIFTSGYDVLVAGQKVAHCTGMVGMVYCRNQGSGQ